MSTCASTLCSPPVDLPSNAYFFRSIRFAPPLVIAEEDLMKAVKVIELALLDLDIASGLFLFIAGF